MVTSTSRCTKNHILNIWVSISGDGFNAQSRIGRAFFWYNVESFWYCFCLSPPFPAHCWILYNHHIFLRYFTVTFINWHKIKIQATNCIINSYHTYPLFWRWYRLLELIFYGSSAVLSTSCCVVWWQILCTLQQILASNTSNTTSSVDLKLNSCWPTVLQISIGSMLNPANMRRWANVGLLLGQRRGRWANRKPT